MNKGYIYTTLCFDTDETTYNDSPSKVYKDKGKLLVDLEKAIKEEVDNLNYGLECKDYGYDISFNTNGNNHGVFTIYDDFNKIEVIRYDIWEIELAKEETFEERLKRLAEEDYDKFINAIDEDRNYYYEEVEEDELTINVYAYDTSENYDDEYLFSVIFKDNDGDYIFDRFE